MGVIVNSSLAQTGLGGPAGYGEIAVPRGDDVSLAINTSAVFQNGFSLAGTVYSANSLYVSTDGFITFGAAPDVGYFDNPNNLNSPFIAAFMADIDTRLDGEGAESGPVWVDVDAVNDVVSITWQNVGFYRRNADLVNTFQIQLFDRGANGIDVVFRYEAINWTSGDLQGGWNGLDGAAARIGLRPTGYGPMGQLVGSGDGAAQLALSTKIGNTGVAGMWVFNLSNTVDIGALPPFPIAPGGSGSDWITGTHLADTLEGNAGDDVLNGGSGADALFGGSGFDFASYAGAANSVTASLKSPSLNTFDAAGDAYNSIEGLVGTAFGDQLQGDRFSNRLEGGAGNDILLGNGGNDTINAGLGDDFIFNALGNSSINGNDGNDRIFVLSGINQLTGSDGHDHIIGGIQSDYIFGGAGNDLLRADASSFIGGSDYLVPGPGNDTLMGGKGADTFVFYPNNGANLVAGFDPASVSFDPILGYTAQNFYTDFQPGLDQIVLNAFSVLRLANVLSYFSNTPTGAVFNLDGTSITLFGISVAQLSANDFTLSLS